MSEMKICLNEKEISSRQNISVHKKKTNKQPLMPLKARQKYFA